MTKSKMIKEEAGMYNISYSIYEQFETTQNNAKKIRAKNDLDAFRKTYMWITAEEISKKYWDQLNRDYGDEDGFDTEDWWKAQFEEASDSDVADLHFIKDPSGQMVYKGYNASNALNNQEDYDEGEDDMFESKTKKPSKRRKMIKEAVGVYEFNYGIDEASGKNKKIKAANNIDAFRKIYLFIAYGEHGINKESWASMKNMLGDEDGFDTEEWYQKKKFVNFHEQESVNWIKDPSGTVIYYDENEDALDEEMFESVDKFRKGVLLKENYMDGDDFNCDDGDICKEDELEFINDFNSLTDTNDYTVEDVSGHISSQDAWLEIKLSNDYTIHTDYMHTYIIKDVEGNEVYNVSQSEISDWWGSYGTGNRHGSVVGDMVYMFDNWYQENKEQSVNESNTSHEKGLDKDKKIIINGVKGTKSKAFSKNFKNYKAYEKWLDKNGDDVDVKHVMNEGRYDPDTKTMLDLLQEMKIYQKK